jgi:hypothetical protein
MKTALQQAIEKVGTLPISNAQLLAVRKMLIALLPTEQQQIEDAYNKGHNDGNDIAFNCNPKHTDFNYYYTKNYDNEQTKS